VNGLSKIYEFILKSFFDYSCARFNHKTAAEDVHIVGDSNADTHEPSVSGDRNHVVEEAEEGDCYETQNEGKDSSALSPSGSDASTDNLEMILVKDVAADAEVGCAPCTSQDTEYFEVSADGKPQNDLLMLLYILHLSDETFDKLSCLETVTDQGIESAAKALGWVGACEQRPSAPSKKRRRQTRQGAKELQAVDLESWLLTARVATSVQKLLGKRDSLYPISSLEEDSAALLTLDQTHQPQRFHAFALRCSERSILRKCLALIT
jgi:hypothetical protein